MSRDLEDIAALLDGNLELESRVNGAPPELRNDIATHMRNIVGAESVLDTLVAQLPRGGDERGRAKRVLALAQRLAA